MTVVAALFVFLVLSIQAANPLQGSWRQPSWMRVTPSPQQPLELTHLGGSYFLSTGLGALAQTLYAGTNRFDVAALLAAAGIGMFLGIRLVIVAFRSKISAER